MLRRPLSSTLFPYTTLFRSLAVRRSELGVVHADLAEQALQRIGSAGGERDPRQIALGLVARQARLRGIRERVVGAGDRKSTRLNSSHTVSSYAVLCLKKQGR